MTNKYKSSFYTEMKKASVSILGEYKNANTKISIVGSCGHKIFRTPEKTLRTLANANSVLCADCAKKKRQDAFFTKGQEDISKEIASYGGTLLSSYAGANNMLTIKGKCGHKLERKIGSLRLLYEKNGTLLCRKCAYALSGRKRRSNPAEVVKTLHKAGVEVSKEDIGLSHDCLEVTGDCGHTFETKLCRVQLRAKKRAKVLCPTCSNTSRSFGEESLSEFVKGLGEEVQDNYTPAGLSRKLEIDVFIPSKNIGIEFNGLNWHSERILSKKYKTPSTYHREKSIFFKEELNVDILHIMEHEWRNARPIMESIIRAKLGKIEHKIYARKCMVSVIDKKDASSFLKENHRQGSCSSLVDIGLEYMGELVAVMSIGAARYSKAYDTELLRFASKLNHSVIGGFSKALSYASSFMSLGKMVSYADARFSSVEATEVIYHSQGFEHLRMSSPNYFYFKRGTQDKVMSRVSFQKHTLKGKLEFYDPSKTEAENMADNKYDRFWDCGNHVFVRDFS